VLLRLAEQAARAFGRIEIVINAHPTSLTFYLANGYREGEWRDAVRVPANLIRGGKRLPEQAPRVPGSAGAPDLRLVRAVDRPHRAQMLAGFKATWAEKSANRCKCATPRRQAVWSGRDLPLRCVLPCSRSDARANDLAMA